MPQGVGVQASERSFYCNINPILRLRDHRAELFSYLPLQTRKLKIALRLQTLIAANFCTIIGMNEVTRILSAIERGERGASADLLPLVYDELRKLAAARLAHESGGQTLQATALVHEAYLRLADAESPWTDRRHFIGIAARSMRQILVERARARGAQKRWGALARVSLGESLAVASPATPDWLPALDDALVRLEQVDPEQARLVELRYFAGLTAEENAKAAEVKLLPGAMERMDALINPHTVSGPRYNAAQLPEIDTEGD